MSVFPRSRLDSEVRSLLQERIAEGMYPVGDALPSEQALAAELGVSRVTLRQALQSLDEAGVLVKRHGVGTFVSEPLPVLECVLHQNLGVTEMILRSGLVPGTAQRSIINPYADDSVAEALNTAPHELVALERVRTANGRPITVTTDVMSRAIVPRLEELDTADVSVYALLETHGVRVQRGTATLVPTQAPPEVAAALEVPAGTVLLMLEQIDFDAVGKPIVFSRELWVRRAIRFVVDRDR